MSAHRVAARLLGPTRRYRGPLTLAIGVALVGDLLLRLSGDATTALLSLLDVVLIVTPLAGLVLGTTRVHHARDVMELMLAQPVSRRRVFLDLWVQGALPLAAAAVFALPPVRATSPCRMSRMPPRHPRPPRPRREQPRRRLPRAPNRSPSSLAPTASPVPSGPLWTSWSRSRRTGRCSRSQLPQAPGRAR